MGVMIKLLSFSKTKFGDYQQSLGYVAGLLLIFFDPATVFKVLTVLNDHPKYLPGYWRGEATACAVDGYVCHNLLKPAIKDKMLGLGLMPETYVQKWFAGITIHHLPYHLLFPFLDNFFKMGNTYLFQFYLAFFDEFEKEIMSANSNPEANALIRFDTEVVRNKFRLELGPRLEKIVQSALQKRFVDIVSKLDFHKARCVGFEGDPSNSLSKRLQGANEGMWQKNDDEIVFSDED